MEGGWLAPGQSGEWETSVVILSTIKNCLLSEKILLVSNIGPYRDSCFWRDANSSFTMNMLISENIYLRFPNHWGITTRFLTMPCKGLRVADSSLGLDFKAFSKHSFILSFKEPTTWNGSHQPLLLTTYFYRSEPVSCY